MNNIQSQMKRADRVLGRFLFRFWAMLAFLGATVSTVFGTVVLVNGHLPGLLILLLGAFLLWIGLRAWGDRTTLADALNRDFEKTPTSINIDQNRGSKK
jgi:hypothetical protein